jgi:type I restriction enzyme S subunit
MEIVGDYPVINGSVEVSDYSDKYNENENTITISQSGASAGFVNWLKTKFGAGARCYVVHLTMEQLDDRYLCFLKGKQVQIMELKHGASIIGLNNDEIPIPPLSIQHSIVSILDTVTELETRKSSMNTIAVNC